ncbi:MAG TPA: hypothetical protein DCE41_09170 [Cytophagales bacterium]|nr:hypothetical protein [Cytophagales bacterium]
MSKFSSILSRPLLAFIFACLVSISQAQELSHYTPPDALTEQQWRVVRPYWTWRTRTVQVFHQDGSLSTGLWLGLYENSIAILKDAANPILAAGEVEVVEIPKSDISALTIDRAWKSAKFTLALYGASQFMYNAFMNASQDLTGVGFLFPLAQLSMGAVAATTWGLYSLAPPFRYISIEIMDESSWNKVYSELKSYGLISDPAHLGSIRRAAPSNPGDPSTWSSLYPVFPTLEKAMEVQPKWSLAFATGGGWLSVGYPQSFASLFDEFAGEDLDPSRHWVAMQAQVRYQHSTRWAYEANLHSWGLYDASKFLQVDPAVVAANPGIDPTHLYSIRADRVSLYAMADYGLKVYDDVQKAPFNISVGGGPGLEIMPIQIPDFTAAGSTDYVRQTKLSAGVRAYFNAEWVITNRFRPFARVVGTYALPVVAESTPLQGTPAIVPPDITIPMANLGLYFGLRTSLDHLKR